MLLSLLRRHLLARHAFLPNESPLKRATFVGEKRLRDEPKERLRRRLKALTMYLRAVLTSILILLDESVRLF